MQAQNVLKTDNIITSDPGDSLSSILNMLTSSHDAAFVFDGKDFLGVINPYYSVIKTNYPGVSKVKTCVMHPPKLDMQSNLVDAARLMVESKIHYLPVFRGEAFEGIVTARRIMNRMIELNSDVVKMSLESYVSDKKPLLTIFEDESLHKAMDMFQDHKVSKLVVVNEKGKLVGIISHYDLIERLSEPKQRQGSDSRTGEKKDFLNKKVKNYMQSLVITLDTSRTVQDAIETMTEKEIGSVVIVNENKDPIGIITTKDVLSLIVPKQHSRILQASMSDVSPDEEKKINAFARNIHQLVSKKHRSGKTELHVKGKQGSGLYSVHLELSGIHSQPNVFNDEHKDLTKLLQDVKKKVKRVLEDE